jgi:hypothetical protein
MSRVVQQKFNISYTFKRIYPFNIRNMKKTLSLVTNHAKKLEYIARSKRIRFFSSEVSHSPLSSLSDEEQMIKESGKCSNVAFMNF